MVQLRRSMIDRGPAITWNDADPQFKQKMAEVLCVYRQVRLIKATVVARPESTQIDRNPPNSEARPETVRPNLVNAVCLERKPGTKPQQAQPQTEEKGDHLSTRMHASSV
jgi:hypothetical protein